MRFHNGAKEGWRLKYLKGSQMPGETADIESSKFRFSAAPAWHTAARVSWLQRLHRFIRNSAKPKGRKVN